MRKLINKNIIKAMTIGLSAVMTFGSFNLAAFAAESEGNPNTQPANEGTDAIDQGAEEAITAADAKDTTETALQTSNASVRSIEEAVKAVDKFKGEVSDLISDKQKESDTYQNIIEAAETLEEELTDDYGVEKDGSKDSSENTSNEADDDGKPAGDTQGEASEGDVAPTEESQGNTSSDDSKPVEETQGTASDGGIAPAGETVVDETDADVIEYLEDVRDDLDAAAKVDAEIDARVTEANGYIDDANAIVESKELAELNEQINAFIEKIRTKTEEEAAAEAQQNESAGQNEDETNNQSGDEADKPVATADGGNENEAGTQADNSETEQDHENSSETEEDTTLIESLEKRGEAVDGYASAVEQATEKEVAEQAVEEARGQKDSAVGEYEDAADELEKLEAAVAAAKANYDDAVGKYNNVKAELDAKLAEYNSLVEQAKESAGEADEEIERLKAEAKALSEAVTEAKDSYNTTGYELIAALEKDIQNNESKQTFLNRSELVKNIMQFYYVPDVLGGTFGEWKSDWYNAPGGDWYDNGVNTNSNGNVLNYGHFTYTDAEGNPQEMYINYKTADGNTEKSKSGVIIFEETEHLVIGNEEKCRDITEDMMDKLDKDGLYVDEEAGFVYVKKDDGSIVRYDTTQGGEFQNGAFNQNQIDDDSNYSVVSEEDIANIPADVSLTDVYIDKNTENASYSFENGKLTKTVTADVTITKYVGTTIVEETSTETKELYKLVFSNVADTARTEYRNDNWYTGNILLAEFENETYTTDGNGGGDYTYTNPEQKPISVTDKTVKANNSDFRSKIDNCAEVAAKYAALADKAVAAQEAVNFAAGEVKELEAQLNKLGKEADLKELKEFTTKISDAKQKLSDAEAIKDSIVSKFDSLEKEFQEKVWEAVNDNNGNGDGTNNGGTTEDGTNDDGGNGTNDSGTTDDETNDDGGNGTNDSGTTDDGTNDDGGNGNGNGTDDGDDNGDDNGSGTETEPEPEANEENVNGGESGSDNGTTDNGTTDNGATDNGTTDNGAADNGNADGGNANAEGGNRNGEQTETIGDEDSALAGDIGGAADNAGIGTVNIGDDDSALAGTIQTKRKWNWWWLLIVAAVTGGTTYGIAKGNQKKKEQADNGSDNN